MFCISPFSFVAFNKYEYGRTNVASNHCCLEIHVLYTQLLRRSHYIVVFLSY